jgi:hypothetical protein
MSLSPALKNKFLQLYYMAISNPEVNARELEMLYKIGEAKGVSRAEIDKLLLQPDLTPFTPPESALEKIDCLYDLCLIAWSDGIIDEDERKTLLFFCSYFGFLDENIPVICEYLLEEGYRDTAKQQVLNNVSKNL